MNFHGTMVRSVQLKRGRRPSSIGKWVAAGMLTALFLYASSARAADEAETRDALARQLRQKVEQLQSLRDERAALQKQRTAGDDAGREQTARLRDQLAETQRRLAAEQQSLGRLERAMADDQRTVDRNMQWLADAQAAMRLLAEQAGQQMRDVPPLKDATPAADLTAAGKSLAGEIDLKNDPASIAVIFQTVGDDLGAGRQVELTNEPITLDGGQRRVHAWRLRIGLAGAVFASEDGRTTGIWSPTQSDHWRLNPSGDQSRLIEALIEVARGRQQPALTPAPLVITGEGGRP